MTALKDIPAEVVELLETLTDEVVVLDLGGESSKDAISAALEGPEAIGRVFVVAPLVNLTKREAVGGKLSADAGVLVLFRCRPAKVMAEESLANDAALAVWLYELLGNAVNAVIGPQATPSESPRRNVHDRYLPSDQPLVIDDSDSGEIRYRLTFLKQTVF
jgi:hypothetical protein